MQSKPSTAGGGPGGLSPTARFWATVWVAVLLVLVLVGNTHNHVPAGLWLLVGAVASTIYQDTRRR